MHAAFNELFVVGYTTFIVVQHEVKLAHLSKFNVPFI